MYRIVHSNQLLMVNFYVPFDRRLSAENTNSKLAASIPWDELEDYYAAQYCKKVGEPAKPFRMALGALMIQASLNLKEKEMVSQIKENSYLQFLIGLEAFEFAAPFDPSMMVYIRKRMPETKVNDCNERTIRNGLDVIQSTASQDLIMQQVRSTFFAA